MSVRLSDSLSGSFCIRVLSFFSVWNCRFEWFEYEKKLGAYKCALLPMLLFCFCFLLYRLGLKCFYEWKSAFFMSNIIHFFHSTWILFFYLLHFENKENLKRNKFIKLHLSAKKIVLLVFSGVGYVSLRMSVHMALIIITCT